VITPALLLGLVLGVVGVVTPADATPVSPSVSESIVAAGLTQPTAIAVAPDGRLFVAEQIGRLRIIQNGQLLGQPFVTLGVDASGERGLLGVTLHPQFPTVPRVYVYYTVPGSPPHNRVSYFTANGNVAGPQTVLYELPALGATNHNGGAIHFGADGMLYVAVGENAVAARAQQLTNPFGKILRINPNNGAAVAGNPFADGGGPNEDRIWAFGLRNPYSFAVQRGTGRIFVNDVGQATWEEVNDLVRGGNYGWPVVEGPSGDPRFVPPFHAYTHAGGACAVTGATFYNPPTASLPPDHVGDFFFGDLCAGWIRRIDLSTRAVADVAVNAGGPVDLAVGVDGALYYVSYNAGQVRRLSSGLRWLIRTPPAPPQLAITYGRSGDLPVPGNWDGVAGDGPGTFRDGVWYLRNAFSSGGATGIVRYGRTGDTPVVGNWDGAGGDGIGTFLNGTWYLRNSATSGGPTGIVRYGRPGDIPLVGDWDGDGTDGIGTFRAGVFYLRHTATTGPAQLIVRFGVSGDVPVVGDWNGQGGDDIGVFRRGVWFIDAGRGGGSAEVAIDLGNPGDRAVTGDWDGNQADGIGVFAGGAWYVRNDFNARRASTSFAFGQFRDVTIAGDWNGDGIDGIGTFLNGSWFLRNAAGSGAVDIVLRYGQAGDIPVVGDWDGDGVDGIGVFRSGTWILRNTPTQGGGQLALAYGRAGDLPVVGDWNGDGRDGIGTFLNGGWYLRQTATAGSPQAVFTFGRAGDRPVPGDWNNNGSDSPGVWAGGSFYLRNSNSSGGAEAVVPWGVTGDMPVVGRWAPGTGTWLGVSTRR
jgi:glucose/arabinose dehydrogenase